MKRYREQNIERGTHLRAVVSDLAEGATFHVFTIDGEMRKEQGSRWTTAQEPMCVT